MSPAHPLDAICFDLDDTLCEYERSTDDVLAVAFEAADVEPFFDAADWMRVIDAGAGSDADTQDAFREACFGALAAERGRDPEHARAVATAYDRERDPANVRFCPGARETLDALDGEYPLACVTNGGPSMQRAKLDALGIADRFETVVCPHPSAGVPPKPEAEPFVRALAAVDATPDRALHVGNSLESDVAGAHNAGLDSAWIHGGDPTNDTGVEPTHSLASVRDLLDVLVAR